MYDETRVKQMGPHQTSSVRQLAPPKHWPQSTASVLVASQMCLTPSRPSDFSWGVCRTRLKLCIILRLIDRIRYAYVSLSLFIYIYIYIYVYSDVYMYMYNIWHIYIYIYIHMFVCSIMYIYIYIYIYTYTYICIHIYIYIYIYWLLHVNATLSNIAIASTVYIVACHVDTAMNKHTITWANNLHASLLPYNI